MDKEIFGTFKLAIWTADELRRQEPVRRAGVYFLIRCSLRAAHLSSAPHPTARKHHGDFLCERNKLRLEGSAERIGAHFLPRGFRNMKGGLPGHRRLVDSAAIRFSPNSFGGARRPHCAQINLPRFQAVAVDLTALVVGVCGISTSVPSLNSCKSRRGRSRDSEEIAPHRPSLLFSLTCSLKASIYDPINPLFPSPCPSF